MIANAILCAQLTTPSNTEENERLHARLIHGDTGARTRMIEGNMPLVLWRVDSLIKRQPQLNYLYDDLVSAGFVGLVRAVDGVPRLPASDRMMVAGYLSKSIFHALIDEIEWHAPVRIPRRSLARLDDLELPVTEVRDVSHDCDLLGLVDLRDLLTSCCHCAREREIVRLRESGYSAEEIADQIGVSRATVYRALREIEDRITHRLAG